MILYNFKRKARNITGFLDSKGFIPHQKARSMFGGKWYNKPQSLRCGISPYASPHRNKMVPRAYPEGFTLIELVIGIVLMGVIILAVFSFEIVSREIFRSAERKSTVQEEAAFVLDHIQKHVWLGEGGGSDPDALDVVAGANPVLRIKNITSSVGNYTFDFDNNRVIFEQEGVNYPLTDRLYNDTASTPFRMELEDFGVRIYNFTLMYAPSGTHHYRNNPKVNISAIYFYPYGQKE